MNADLEKYAKAFRRLKRGGTRYGLAPHKPILLLSIIELIEKGVVVNNEIVIDAQLVGTFKENWELLVFTPHQADFTQPFFYLKNDTASNSPFWFIKTETGYAINGHIKSVSVLSKICQYGYFTDDLWILLNELANAFYLKQVLLDHYFPDAKKQWLSSKSAGNGYLHQQTLDLLNDPESRYVHVSKQTEEDMFVRNGLFKRFIPQIYHQRCSFTGMSLRSLYNHNFIDACHIVPFSVSHNDNVSNGIALCPNMHRAFDRGLLTIDQDFRIVVSNHFVEDTTHSYALEKLEGRQILLPKRVEYYPSRDALDWHKTNVFKF